MDTQNLTLTVQKALDEIRPFLLADGGDISLVSIEENVVKVKLEGACVGCSINQMTLRNGVEASIKKHAPQIEKVIDLSSILWETFPQKKQEALFQKLSPHQANPIFTFHKNLTNKTVPVLDFVLNL